MINKEEYLILFEKYLANQCSDAELQLLNEYRDEINFEDPEMANELVNRVEIRKRILNRLLQSRNIRAKNHIYNLTLITTAAAILLLLAAGLTLWYTNNSSNISKPAQVLAGNKSLEVIPGSDQATLTMANGTTVNLNNITNRPIPSQSGIKITRAGNGIISYHFTGTKDDETVTGNNIITTPKGGQYQVVLADGTKVWLNSASSLSFPVAFTRDYRKVELTGEAYFEVSKDKKKPFTVSANGTDIQVLGTHFNVNAYQDNPEVATTLLEGSVRMKKGSSAALLAPGEQGVCQNSSNLLAVKKVDLNEVMAWKNGYFIFHDENIVTIMRQLARWYDVEVIYRSDEVKDREFGGTVSRYKDIKELLDYMELTQAIHYKLEGRRLFIMK